MEDRGHSRPCQRKATIVCDIVTDEDHLRDGTADHPESMANHQNSLSRHRTWRSGYASGCQNGKGDWSLGRDSQQGLA